MRSTLLRSALAIAQEIDDPQGVVYSRESIASLHLARGGSPPL